MGLWSARLVNVGQLTRWRHSDLCRALLPRQGERRGACAPRNTRDRDGAKGGGGSFSSAVRAAAFRYERTAPRAGSLVLVLHVPPRRERSLSASARHRSLWIYRQSSISDQRHQAPLLGTSIGRVETATVVIIDSFDVWTEEVVGLKDRNFGLGLISWFCFPKFWLEKVMDLMDRWYYVTFISNPEEWLDLKIGSSIERASWFFVSNPEERLGGFKDRNFDSIETRNPELWESDPDEIRHGEKANIDCFDLCDKQEDVWKRRLPKKRVTVDCGFLMHAGGGVPCELNLGTWWFFCGREGSKGKQRISCSRSLMTRPV